MSCFGLCFTQESSRQPRKGYNLLVPAVFPDKAPAWDAPLDTTTLRKIGNVEEYVSANVQRCPAVSSKLSKRIVKESLTAAGLGQCKVLRSYLPAGNAQRRSLCSLVMPPPVRELAYYTSYFLSSFSIVAKST
jgi:hypothetical protein